MISPPYKEKRHVHRCPKCKERRYCKAKECKTYYAHLCDKCKRK